VRTHHLNQHTGMLNCLCKVLLYLEKNGVEVIVWYLDLQLSVLSVSITTKVMSSNPIHGEVYSIQHYVIKFVSDTRQVRSCLRILRFPPPITAIWNSLNKSDMNKKNRFLTSILKMSILNAFKIPGLFYIFLNITIRIRKNGMALSSFRSIYYIVCIYKDIIIL
jgi:hypothetical protein